MASVPAPPKTQKAVLLHPPAGSRNVKVDDIAIPTIQDPDDAIVRVLASGLCGSDLHPYRGHYGDFDEPYVMGHELYGEIVNLGSNFNERAKQRPSGYYTMKIGDKVLSAFTVSCLECEYCIQGFTSRCVHSLLLGSPVLPGAQAQYARIPKAGGTLIIISPLQTSPKDPPLDPRPVLLIADILPTGYFAAFQAFTHGNLSPILRPEVPTALPSKSFLEDVAKPRAKGTVVEFAVIGLGPVGLCGLVALVDIILDFLFKKEPRFQDHRRAVNNPVAFQITAFDLLPTRLSNAKVLAEKIKDRRVAVVDEFAVREKMEMGKVQIRILASDKAPSSFAHAVLEVVGSPSALSLAAKVSRPFGVISSVGVHTSATFGIPPPDLYAKNLSLSFGRCPARALMEPAFGVLTRHSAALDGLVERLVPMGKESDVKDAYAMFEAGGCGKLAFDPWA